MDRINNNIKFYTFIEILETYSDKNVSLSIKEINNHMKKRLGLKLDRRTIYNYMRDMKVLGFDVSDYDKNKEGYYLNSHSLEPHEIRILTDAILTSNFVTKKKTLELVKKLKSFNSIYQNKDFLKNIYIEDIPKSKNEEIFTNIAKINEAIKLEKKIKFNYCNYDYCKNLVYRLDDEGNPKEYVKSPVYMILRNKNYYLVCAEEDLGIFQNFRVDRMLNTSVMENEKIVDLSQFEDCRNGLNPMEYLRKNLKMFSGKSNIMIVEFKENLLNYLLDEFGDYIYIMEKDNYEKNNLSESISKDNFVSQILKKIMGEKDYQDYILSGKYMKNNFEREKIDDFIKKLDSFVSEIYKQDENSEKCQSENCKISGVDSKECSIKGDEKNCKIVDCCTDKKVRKVYIGIFVAKESMGLTKWLMQFGTDIKVVWPDSMRNLMFCQIDELRKFYLEDNGQGDQK